MRAKEDSIVISFQSTADAIAFEKKAMDLAFPGRLIPIPKAITAGCGMAWMIRKKGLMENWKEALQDLQCSYDCIYRLKL